MKSVIKALLAASMLMPIAAQAQEQDGRERGQGRRGEWGERAARPDRSAEVGVQAQVRTERPQARDFGRQRSERDQNRPRPDMSGGGDGRREGWTGQDRNADGGNRWRERRGADTPQILQPRAEQDRYDRRRFDQSRVHQGRPDRQDERRFDRRDDSRGLGDRDRDGSRQWSDRDGARQWSDRTRKGYDQRQAFGQPRSDWRGNAGRLDNRGSNWNRSWRNDTRYDWNRYRQANRSAYRLPRYYAPSGWGYGYRRFSVGVSLSSILFSQNYWIDDPYDYRLPEAYGPFRWIRYYDDALLVDIRSGQVVDSVYGIFD
ncbi:RcnB family protein [Sphingomonadaceae bacterium OTU29MARTA1]|nr:RcnB family protein [Sphingomonadaceae bacterium OTU29MARTA1]